MELCRFFVPVLLALSVLLAGCAGTETVSLSEVRQFADASAKLGGYGELSRRYRDTYEREQPYLSPAVDKIARDNDARRKAVYTDFVSIQKAVVLYMQTLSVLAGATRYDLSAQADRRSASSSTWRALTSASAGVAGGAGAVAVVVVVVGSAMAAPSAYSDRVSRIASRSRP